MPAPTPINLQILTLARDFKPGQTDFYVYDRFQKTSLSTVAKYLIGKQVVCFGIFSSTSELAFADIIAQPTLVSGTTNMYKYSVETRGTDSDNTTFPPTKYSSDMEKTHRAQVSKVAIVMDNSHYATIIDAFNTNVATRFVQFPSFDKTTDVTVGNGRDVFIVPAKYDGENLAIANAVIGTAGVTGSTTINIYNVTKAQYMLSTPITILSGATTGSGVIDEAADDISTGDILRVDILTASSGTAPKGLNVNLEFEN